MIDYMGMMLAELKVDEMKRSVASCGDTDRGESDQPGWVSKQVGRLLQVVGNEMTSLGQHMSHERHTALAAPLKGQQ